MSRPKQIIFWSLVILGVFGLFRGVKIFSASGAEPLEKIDFKSAKIKIGDRILTVDLAQSDKQHKRGLSHRPSLAADAGILFIFGLPTKPGFWMKAMNFPLDIVWIDNQKQIVAITKNLAPDSYPQIVTPPLLVKYVLEINAGEADKMNLKVGDILKFKHWKWFWW